MIYTPPFSPGPIVGNGTSPPTTRPPRQWQIQSYKGLGNEHTGVGGSVSYSHRRCLPQAWADASSAQSAHPTFPSVCRGGGWGRGGVLLLLSRLLCSCFNSGFIPTSVLRITNNSRDILVGCISTHGIWAHGITQPCRDSVSPSSRE